MKIVALGVNHDTAELALREQLAFTQDALPSALQRFTNTLATPEAVLLSTCNRTEIYTTSTQPQQILDWLTQHTQVPANRLETCCYYHQDLAAVKHLMRVASGLDSMVLGEPQILGQIKKAYQTACCAGTVGNQLQALFQHVFNTSKAVREQTDIGKHPISFAYGCVQLSKQIFSSLKKRRILFIGTGETIELAARHFHNQGWQQAWFAARNIDKAEAFAKPFQGKPLKIGDVPNYLEQADIVVTATASQLPILGKGAIETALKQHKHRPLLIFDLAVPRDVEPEAADLEDVFIYNIDDLQQVILSNKKTRQEAAEAAEEIVTLAAQHYMQQLNVHQASSLIQDYRQHLTALSEQQLAQAKKLLKQGRSPEDVLALFANQLVNKILHQPTIQMREAAYNGELEKLKWLKKLFQ